MSRIEFTKKIKIIAGISIALAIVLMIGLNSIVIVPKKRELKGVQTELVSVERELTTSRAEQKRLSNEKSLFESESIKGIPQKIQIAEYFKNIQRQLLEKKASISESMLEEKEYFKVKGDSSKTLCQGNFNMTLGATTKESLMEYLKSIDTDNRFIKFDSLDFEGIGMYEEPSPEDILDNSVYKVTLSFSVYFIINNEEQS